MKSSPVILIVDDEEGFLEVTSAKLEANNFTVQKASSAKAAKALIDKGKPDLVLMDVQMPEKDGVEFTTELMSDPKNKGLKIMFLTNLGDSWPTVAEVNRRFAQEIGAVDYFKKGADLDKLVKKVQELVAA